jgi:hypothetical protein
MQTMLTAADEGTATAVKVLPGHGHDPPRLKAWREATVDLMPPLHQLVGDAPARATA